MTGGGGEVCLGHDIYGGVAQPWRWVQSDEVYHVLLHACVLAAHHPHRSDPLRRAQTWDWSESSVNEFMGAGDLPLVSIARGGMMHECEVKGLVREQGRLQRMIRCVAGGRRAPWRIWSCDRELERGAGQACRIRTPGQWEAGHPKLLPA